MYWYAPNAIRYIIPSSLLMWLSKPVKSTSSGGTIINAMDSFSILCFVLENLTGDIIATKPIIRQRLAIGEPIRVPMPRSAEACNVDIKAVVNSGREFPIASTREPTMNPDSPILLVT